MKILIPVQDVYREHNSQNYGIVLGNDLQSDQIQKDDNRSTE